MSAAAAALNKAEMGIKAVEKTDENKKLLSISSDQLYVGDDEKKAVISDNEAAAITMAKEAAKSFAQLHPDT